MTPVIALLVGVAATMTVVGAVIAWFALRQAPDGRETEHGWEMTAARSREGEERVEPKASGTNPQFS